MKKLGFILLCLFVSALSAIPISAGDARILASGILSASPHRIVSQECLVAENLPLAHIFRLNPSGYLVLGALDVLPPVVAYSLDSQFGACEDANPLYSLIKHDLSSRLALSRQGYSEEWQALRSNTPLILSNDYLLSSNWNQSYPWNMMCPMDPVSHSRSVAGCPAIAMGQILNYLGTTNDSRFGDADDYYHSYSGRTYMIDDDYEEMDFPSFGQLNSHMNHIDSAFAYGYELADSLEAALVFACGTALKQIYSSQVSGTFSVNQAFSAYQRFAFSSAELLGPDAPDLYSRMISNLAAGYPVHLAVVTPAEDAGHNVVVDGYNAEGLYHLNFGWGGQYNGWYALPDDIPYGLTVVEGAVVDIIPAQRIFCYPEQLHMQAGDSCTLDITNLLGNEQQLIDIVFGEGLNAAEWELSASLPAVIPPMGMISVQLSHLLPARDEIESTIRLVFNGGYQIIPITFNPSSAISDGQQNPVVAVQAVPNPFNEMCKWEVQGSRSAEAKLKIYNLKGQLLHQSRDLSWDGRDASGRECISGVYLYRISGKDFIRSGKILKF